MASSPPPERPPKRSTAVKADIHALLGAVDLLRRGFAVFRKLGRASPCDLVIVRGRRCSRVAVRTVYSISPRGKIFPRWPPDLERFDVVAYMLPDGGIRYEPPLERLHDGHGSPVRGRDRRMGGS
jgi:hypothetical protein